eukprot:6148094-Pyramimonas_sp.AAC.1
MELSPRPPSHTRQRASVVQGGPVRRPGRSGEAMRLAAHNGAALPPSLLPPTLCATRRGYVKM